MKQKKKELLYQEAGKYFLDLSKLVFGGIILAEIMNLDIDGVAVFGVGGVAVVGFALFGFHYYSKSKKIRIWDSFIFWELLSCWDSCQSFSRIGMTGNTQDGENN